MKDKKPDKPVQVSVHGKLTGLLDPDGAEHQVYRYHVNINEPGNTQSHEYDREIHIFKSVKQPEQDAANTSPTEERLAEAPPVEEAIEINEPPVAETPAPVVVETELSPESVAPPPPVAHGKNPSTSLSNRINSAVASVKKTFSWPFKKKLALPVFKRPRIQLKLPSLPKPAHHIKSASHYIKNIFTGFRLPVKRTSPAKPPPEPETTSSGKSRKKILYVLPAGKSGKALIRFCLPCIMLTLVAIAVYLLGDFKAREKIIYPIDKKQTTTGNKTAVDYHAVIEKTGNGVVITLQGPDHEEVLTKLPPGYDPVVEGNKIVHVVTPGNTLWFIAMRYIKNPYRYPELARLNNIKNPDLIYPGEKVIIQYIRKP